MSFRDIILLIVVPVVISGGFSSIIIFLITRHDNKNSKLNQIVTNQEEMKEHLTDVKRDLLRLQILNLVQHEPKNKDTILNLYDTYTKLKGNSYISTIIEKWRLEYCITK